MSKPPKNQERQRPWDAGVAVPLPPEAGFAVHEHWAWARIIRGERADMRYFPKDEAARAEGANGEDDGKGNDPNKSADWPAHRDLSARFMQTILFHEPWANARARPFVRIACARFAEELDWENETFAGEIELSSSLFQRDLVWRGLAVGKLLDLQGSRVEGALHADRLAVDGGLFCHEGFSAKGDIRLVSAHVEGVVVFNGAKLEGALSADRLVVDGSLFCDEGFSAKGDIRLVSAHAKGNVSFTGAKLEGTLQASGLVVGGYCYLCDLKKLAAADLLGARVGQDLQLSGSAIEGEVDLTGAEIKGELNLMQFKGDEPKWGAEAHLILRNAKAGALAGGISAFRDGKTFVRCKLAGFTYGRIGGLGAGAAGSTLASAKGHELRAWLKACRAQDHFDPAPYRALAKALDDSGRADRAADVRNALGNYELVARGTPLSQRAMLALSWLFIGYGERNHRASIVFALLVLAAAGIGYWQDLVWLPAATPAGWTDWQAWRDWIGYAFGDAVPLLSFDEAHKTFLADRFSGHGVPTGLTAFFYAIKIGGFVILSYLAAGLSGLAQRRG